MTVRTPIDAIHPTDRLYETITLRASWGRAWLAISNAQEFGAWFGAHFVGDFVPQKTIAGSLEPTTADRELAVRQARFTGLPIELAIERIEPDRLVAFRWHPFTIGFDAGGTSDTKTLVELELNGDPEGVVLTVTESGFQNLPPARRAMAFAAHEQGWEQELLLVKRHVERVERLDERWFRARAHGQKLAATPP